MTNPFSQTMAKGWEWPVAVMSLVLGVMISGAWISNKNQQSRAQAMDPDVARRLFAGKIDVAKLTEITAEVQRLQAENEKYQGVIANRTGDAAALNDTLKEVKLWAGLTEVEGPGITVTLRDSVKKGNISDMDRIIHDSDVLRVTNELWASGAEAIEVNGNRLAGCSSIRCVGPVIHVDGRPIASPIMIRAIGSYETLNGGINLPGGPLEQIRNTDPDMVSIDRVKMHRFNTYTGSLTRTYLTPVTSKK